MPVETDSVATDPKQSNGAQTVVPEMDVLEYLTPCRSCFARRSRGGDRSFCLRFCV
jgi:hypothetical protein